MQCTGGPAEGTLKIHPQPDIEMKMVEDNGQGDHIMMTLKDLRFSICSSLDSVGDNISSTTV